MNINYSDLGLSASSVSFIATLVIAYSAVMGIIALALYFLKAVGIYNMATTAGLKNPWMAFIPVVNSFTYGKLAEKYKKRDGTQSMKFGIVLVVLEAFVYVMAIVFMILSIDSFIQIIVNADKALQNNTEMTISMFSSLIPVIVISFIMAVAGIVYAVISYIALWRIFSSFDYKNATLFTVLAVFFSFLQPIFLFVVRKNPATFEYSERMGIYTNNY